MSYGGGDSSYDGSDARRKVKALAFGRARPERSGDKNRKHCRIRSCEFLTWRGTLCFKHWYTAKRKKLDGQF